MNSLFNIIYSLLHKIYSKMSNNNTYNNFYGYDDIISQDVDKFRKTSVNKVIYVLNNLPSKIFSLIFDRYKHVSNEYFQITMSKINNKYVVTHQQLIGFGNVMNDSDVRYLYIRINLVNKKGKYNMNHVNCIVIDKEMRYILYFEPTCYVQINVKYLANLLFEITPVLSDYTILLPKDLGYSYINRLQYFDNYCQTYILYIFCLILENPHIDTNKYSELFNSIITEQNVLRFLQYIDGLLTNNGMDVSNLSVDNNKYEDNVDNIKEDVDDDYLLIY